MYIVSKSCDEFPAENGALGVFDNKKLAIKAVRLYVEKRYGNATMEEVVALPGFKNYHVEVDGHIITFIVEPCDMNYMEEVGEVVDNDDDWNIGRNADEGLYNGEPTYCPVNAYGDCPYCDHRGICNIDDPMEDCSDWAEYYDSWDDWLAKNTPEEDNISDDDEWFVPGYEKDDIPKDDEIRFAGDIYGYDDTMEDNEE